MGPNIFRDTGTFGKPELLQTLMMNLSYSATQEISSQLCLECTNGLKKIHDPCFYFGLTSLLLAVLAFMGLSHEK